MPWWPRKENSCSFIRAVCALLTGESIQISFTLMHTSLNTSFQITWKQFSFTCGSQLHALYGMTQSGCPAVEYSPSPLQEGKNENWILVGGPVSLVWDNTSLEISFDLILSFMQMWSSEVGDICSIWGQKCNQICIFMYLSKKDCFIRFMLGIVFVCQDHARHGSENFYVCHHAPPLDVISDVCLILLWVIYPDILNCLMVLYMIFKEINGKTLASLKQAVL